MLLEKHDLLFANPPHQSKLHQLPSSLLQLLYSSRQSFYHSNQGSINISTFSLKTCYIQKRGFTFVSQRTCVRCGTLLKVCHTYVRLNINDPKTYQNETTFCAFHCRHRHPSIVSQARTQSTQTRRVDIIIETSIGQAKPWKGEMIVREWHSILPTLPHYSH